MIDKQQNAKLRERFNPDGSQLRKHQMRMLDMLIYFDNVCKEHNIKYWINSGTLLGAVRHGGFIPWDDDLDITMLRDDYKKLELIWLDSDYFLQTYKSDPFYVVPYAKMRDKNSIIKEHSQDANYTYKGIYIDIFVMEACPHWAAYISGHVCWIILKLGSRAKSKLSKSIFYILKKTFYLSIGVLRPILRMFASKNILRFSYGSAFSNYTLLYDKVFPLSEIEFEGHSFPSPNNPDNCLRRFYGDYLCLPDLNALQPHLTEMSFLDK